MDAELLLIVVRLLQESGNKCDVFSLFEPTEFSTSKLCDFFLFLDLWSLLTFSLMIGACCVQKKQYPADDELVPLSVSSAWRPWHSITVVFNRTSSENLKSSSSFSESDSVDSKSGSLAIPNFFLLLWWLRLDEQGLTTLFWLKQGKLVADRVFESIVVYDSTIFLRA